MGPNMDIWGDGGNYTTYSLSRGLLANESLELYIYDGGARCGSFLNNYEGVGVVGNKCYPQPVGISCMKMGAA